MCIRDRVKGLSRALDITARRVQFTPDLLPGDITGTPVLPVSYTHLRFQCKSCRSVTVAETSIVEKNCQISNLVRQKVTQLLTEKVSLTDIARRLRVSTSTGYRKLDQFTFKEHYDKLPAVMSMWLHQRWLY